MIPPTDPAIPPTDPATPYLPAKDPIVDRAYDYAKWHIALYGTVLGVLAGGLALQKELPPYLFVSVGFLVVAGIAAGTIASELSRREYWDGFLQTRTFPLLPDSKNVSFTMQTWMHIQHAGVWAAVIWGVGAAFVFSLPGNASASKAAKSPTPSVSTVAPTP